MFAASAIKDLEDRQAYYPGEGVPDAWKRLIDEIIAKVSVCSKPFEGKYHFCHASSITSPF
jgi:hypothetical protein